METPNGIYVRQMELGPLANFVYLIGDPHTREVAVVDPAWSVPAILKAAEADNVTITKVLLTHAHFDHTNGLRRLLKRLDIPVYIHKDEAKSIKAAGDARVVVEDGDTAALGDVEVTFLHTPGHTPGSQCLLAADALISGDTLFVDACGRMDLSGSDPRQMYDSIHNKLMKLDGRTILFPGHNYGVIPSATLEEQARTNIFMRVESLDQFLAFAGC